MNLVYKKHQKPLLDPKKVKDHWKKFKSSRPSDQIVFDSNILCGIFSRLQKNTLEIMECKFSEYIYGRSQNLPLYSLAGFACILTKDGEMLIIERGEHLLYFPGHFSLVGGHLELTKETASDISGTSIFKMTNEEVKEEIGIDLESIKCQHRFCFHIFNHERKTVHFYFIVQTQLEKSEIEQMVKLEEDEVAGIQFLTSDELMTLHEKISPVLEKFVQNASKVDNHGTNDILSLENYNEDILYIQ